MENVELLTRIISRETRHIYTSTVDKLDYKVVHKIGINKENHLPLKDPYLNNANNEFWRRLKVRSAHELVDRVMEATLSFYGWKVKTFLSHNQPPNGEHDTFIFQINGMEDCNLEITTPLPVLQTPIWRPSRFGGSWSFFELHMGDCYRLIMDLIKEVKKHIRDVVLHHSLDVVFTPVGLVRPTKHVRNHFKGPKEFTKKETSKCGKTYNY